MTKAQTLVWALLTAIGGGGGVLLGIAIAHSIGK
jgi:hypothetical protein